MSVVLRIRLRSLREKLFRTYLEEEIVNFLRDKIQTSEDELSSHLENRLNRRVGSNIVRASISRLVKSGRISNDNGSIMIANAGEWTLFKLNKRYGLTHGSAYRPRESFDPQFEIIRKAASTYRFDFSKALELGNIENLVTAINDDINKLKDPSMELHTRILASRKTLTPVVQVIGVFLTVIGLIVTLYLGLR